MLNIKQTIKDKTIIYALNGDIDMSTDDELDHISQNIDGYNKIVLDFANIKFVDSSGIGKLIHISREIKSKDVELKFRNISEEVGMIFNMLGVYEVIGENAFE